MLITMKCPYCGKQKDISQPGAYWCTRCTGKFRVSPDFSVTKVYFDNRWRIASISILVVVGLILLLIHMGMPQGGLRARLENITVGIWGFLYFGFGVIQAIRKGVLYGKGANMYCEDNPSLFTVFTYIWVVLGLLCLLLALLEIFDVFHFRQS